MRSGTRVRPCCAEFERRDAAIHRRPVVLQAGRHLDGLRFDVHRRCQQRLGVGRRAPSTAPARRRRRRSAPTIRQCRRRPAIPTRAHGHAAHVERRGQSSQERQRLVVAQRRRRVDDDPAPGVLGDDFDVSSSRGSRRDMGAEADGGVQRLRAVVKEIERPDIDGAAGQIDARRRRSRNSHAHIIIL